MSKKALKVCCKVSLSKNFQQSCSAINHPSNGINTVAGDDPVPVKFGLKYTHPNRKDARFTFHTQSAVQSALAGVLVHPFSVLWNSTFIYRLKLIVVSYLYSCVLKSPLHLNFFDAVYPAFLWPFSCLLRVFLFVFYPLIAIKCAQNWQVANAIDIKTRR